MAGKLGKLKCMLKRWHSRGRLAAAPSLTRPHDDVVDAWQHFPGAVDGDVRDPPAGLHPVYVGKSRRRYLINSDLVDHPLFRVLAQRSAGPDCGGAATVVGCEVVLFEHLLWMLENADPQPESIDELVEFYAC